MVSFVPGCGSACRSPVSSSCRETNKNCEHPQFAIQTASAQADARLHPCPQYGTRQRRAHDEHRLQFTVRFEQPVESRGKHECVLTTRNIRKLAHEKMSEKGADHLKGRGPYLDEIAVEECGAELAHVRRSALTQLLPYEGALIHFRPLADHTATAAGGRIPQQPIGLALASSGNIAAMLQLPMCLISIGEPACAASQNT